MKGFFKALAVVAALFAVAVLLFHEKDTVKGRTNRLEIFYMYNEGEPQSDWILDAAKRFGKLNPGLEVDVIFAGRDVLEKIRPRLIMGNPPDIVNQGGDILRVLMEDDLLEPLDDALAAPAMDRDIPWGDTFVGHLQDIYTFKGRHYQIPVGLFCNVIFYNKDQFERFGLKKPRTWKEFLNVCQVLKNNGIEPIAADGTERGYNVMWISTMLTRTSKIAHIKETALGKEGTSWTEEPFVEAARLIRELLDKGYIMKGYKASKWPAAQIRWAQGKCGLLYNGTWIPKEMKDKLPEGFRMGMFRFPVVEAFPDADGMKQDIGAECYAIPRGAKNKAKALEFLKFITRRRECKEYVKMDIAPAVLGGGMPESLAGLDELLMPPYSFMRGVAGISADSPELQEWYRQVARDIWNDAFLGKYTPDQMCRKMDEVQKRFYERKKDLEK